MEHSLSPRIRPGSTSKVQMVEVTAGRVRRRSDVLITEEPLEIRLLAGEQRATVAVTMRTPGADFALAAGFLFTEGLIAGREEIRRITYCVEQDAPQQYNVVQVELLRHTLPDLGRQERYGTMSSACGVCGKTSIDALSVRHPAPLTATWQVAPAVISSLPERLRRAQMLFDATGGIHAAALFTPQGELRTVQEDVGRHNALDKLIGEALLAGELPWSEAIVLVSGRASFELVQKSLAAGVPILCAVSAPSSLACDVAQRFGMTLIGFVRDQRFNIYAGAERVCGVASRVHQAPDGC